MKFNSRRGIYYLIALKGALKLKEITYIHAEACPAGELFVFTDRNSHFNEADGVPLRTPCHVGVLSPVVRTIPVQLLPYHAALARGTDVDKPRNLAKSVTVE